MERDERMERISSKIKNWNREDHEGTAQVKCVRKNLDRGECGGVQVVSLSLVATIHSRRLRTPVQYRTQPMVGGQCPPS